ncbi:MAG: hypothetical protein E7231_08115 [Cellulosilyticum sp.]|nr:hypothetical protein [Cellulosilyticum sp.]
MNTSKHLTYTEYLKAIIPNILVHISSLLVKVVELGMMGKLLSPAYIAGYGISKAIFNTIDWGLTFLRVSVMTESEKAYGTKDSKAQVETLLQHVMCMFLIGWIIIFMKENLWDIVMGFYKLEAEVVAKGYIYYKVCVWSLPIALANYVILGWFFGRGEKIAIILDAACNMIHVILCYILVTKMNLNIAGIALARCCTQMVLFISCISVFLIKERALYRYIKEIRLWSLRGLLDRLKDHLDVLERMGYSCLITHMMLIASSGIGTNILAANIIILQFRDVMAYFFDAIATTIRGYAVKLVQNQKMEMLREMHNMTVRTTMFLGIGFVIMYQIGRTFMVGWMTNLSEVKHAVWSYDGWLSIYPIVAGWGLTANGIYKGLMKKRELNQSLAVSFIVFTISYVIFLPLDGNHGLWLAFNSFYFTRSLSLLTYESYLYD